LTDEPKSPQQAAQDALDQSQQRYRELVEHSLGLICAHDFTGKLLFVNPAAAQSLGYEPEEGAGANLRDFLAPASRDRFDVYLERIRRNGVDAGLMRLVAKDGRERTWMYRNILHDEPPEPPRILGHAVDITDRVEAEEALHQSQDALKQTLAELDSRVKERTSALQAVLARERANLGLWTNISSQLVAELDYEATLHKVASLPVPFLADWSLLHIPHENGTCRCIAGRHADQSRQSLVERLAREGPSLLPSESCVAEVLNASRRGIFTSDSDDLAVRLLGPGAHVDLVRSLGAASVAVVPLATGSRGFAALSLVSGVQGRYSVTEAALLDDVARRFAVAIDRSRLYRETQEANRLKDDFLATLSHELRTPLNAILGWVRIMRSRQLDKGTDRAAEVIERNADALTRLVEDLLDVSGIIKGKLTLNLRPIDLPVVLGAALDSIRPAARAKGIELIHQIEPTAAILGDDHRLQQVFWNLLSNAVKFTGSGGTVTVTLVRSGDTVTTSVTDTGVGIRRDVLPFVFDRFRQADASTSRSHGGLGLGLSIVRHIVESHGGNVRASSVEGKGTTFEVQLPANDLLSGRRPLQSEDAAAQRAGGPVLVGVRVLIIDDDPDARDLVAEIIRAEGGIVVTAASSPEALDAMTSFEPEVLIADIGLPDEDGYQFIRRVRARTTSDSRQPLAIALTGYARIEDRARALAAGYEEHVAKPVEPPTLVHILRTLIDARR
jgi:PAS domain S-box-containing protein